MVVFLKRALELETLHHSVRNYAFWSVAQLRIRILDYDFLSASFSPQNGFLRLIHLHRRTHDTDQYLRRLLSHQGDKVSTSLPGHCLRLHVAGFRVIYSSECILGWEACHDFAG